MYGVVFKVALAAIIAAGMFFMLATILSEANSTTNVTVSNIETARGDSLNDSAYYLQR